MEKDNLNHWYRDRFNRLDEQPPADVWEGIANELDVQEVWERVDNKLALTEQRVVFRKRLAWAASLLILLLLGGAVLKYSLSNKEDEQYAQGPASQHSPGQKKNTNNDLPAAPGHDPVAPGSKKQPAVNSTKGASLNAPVVNDSQPSLTSNNNAGHHKPFKKEKIEQPAPTASSAFVQSSAGARYNVDSVSLSPLMHDQLDQEPLAMELTASPLHLPADSFYSTYKPVSAGISAGPAASVNNVWLLNRTTIAGLKNSALYQTDLTFGRSYGASVVYDTKGKWGVQADMMLDAEQGQGYHYYDEGAYAAKLISAHYYQLGVLARRKKASRFFSTSLPASGIWSFGPEARWMKSILVDVNRPGKQRTARFARFDYGVHFGYEYELQVQRNLIVSAGFGASIGLNNVNRGQSNEPGKFNATYNAAAGVQLGLRYILSAK